MSTKKEDKIIEVAKYFIQKSQKEVEREPSRKLDALKLQKLLYYSKAWTLVLREGHRIFDDDFQAWVHGPANPKVWHYFKDFDFSASHPEILEEGLNQITDDEKKVLDEVWSAYGKFDGKYLEMLTHAETPWLNARQGLDNSDVSQNVISEESMRSFYERRLQEAQ